MMMQVRNTTDLNMQPSIFERFASMFDIFMPTESLAMAARAVGVFVVTIGTVFGGGLVSAQVTRNSQPGDSFYKMKLAVERLQLALAPNGDYRTRLHTDFADRRIDEIAKLAESPKAEAEEAAPGFAHTPAAALPEIEVGGARLRVLAGEVFGAASPVRTASPTLLVDARLAAGDAFPAPPAEERALYGVDGGFLVDGGPVPAQTLVLLRPGEEPLVSAAAEVRLALIGGAPLGERFLWWNFLSSRRERIRQAVEGHEFRVGSEAPLHLTCSAGAAVFPFLPDFPEACDWERVLEIADTCLYAAKRSGRNAWVWVVSTDRACPETLPPDLPRRIEDLAQAGLLKGHSSLPPGTAIRWPN